MLAEEFSCKDRSFDRIGTTYVKSSSHCLESAYPRFKEQLQQKCTKAACECYQCTVTVPTCADEA